MRIGIIGGSGFYQMEGLTDIEEIEGRNPIRQTERCPYPGQS